VYLWVDSEFCKNSSRRDNPDQIAAIGMEIWSNVKHKDSRALLMGTLQLPPVENAGMILVMFSQTGKSGSTPHTDELTENLKKKASVLLEEFKKKHDQTEDILTDAELLCISLYVESTVFSGKIHKSHLGVGEDIDLPNHCEWKCFQTHLICAIFKLYHCKCAKCIEKDAPDFLYHGVKVCYGKYFT